MNDTSDCSKVSVFNPLFELLKVRKILNTANRVSPQCSEMRRCSQENTKPLYIVNLVHNIHENYPKPKSRAWVLKIELLEHSFLERIKIHHWTWRIRAPLYFALVFQFFLEPEKMSKSRVFRLWFQDWKSQTKIMVEICMILKWPNTSITCKEKKMPSLDMLIIIKLNFKFKKVRADHQYSF